MIRRHQFLFLMPGFLCLPFLGGSGAAEETSVLEVGKYRASVSLRSAGAQRTYELTTNAELRDSAPASNKVTFSETPQHATIRTGNLLFDGLYALAVSEARQNSVSQISDDSYDKGRPLAIEAFQTGERWKYVWTRDLSYSLSLALAAFDPQRAANSLLFKASQRKAAVVGGVESQIIQDTGSGGSYPISTDRIVWALGADETLKYLTGAQRAEFLQNIYPILCGTIEQDRQLVFNPATGLYRGEESFLDWREQTYPGWTKNSVLAVGMSEALSVNTAMSYALEKTAEYAGLLKDPEKQKKYAKWARELKEAINRQFIDPSNGLYRSYFLSSDGSYHIPAARYDLLGLSLAILTGVADKARAEAIIRTYPTGPFGPPVVWPEEKNADIYHNQAIWPFVTAFWAKAAQKVGNAAAVDAAIQSLYEQAALNLSNMENFDFVTGKAEIEQNDRIGPVVNSHRQLWSVAGYLSMVQDVVFGLETSLDGIRFLPCVPAKLRHEILGSSDQLELQNFSYRGTRHHVQVHLPPAGLWTEGSCRISRIELNSEPVAKDFIRYENLPPENRWEIFLDPPAPGEKAPGLARADVTSDSAIFAPAPPQWTDDGQGGLTIKENHIALHYRHPAPAGVSFNIYRDGELCAQDVREARWLDNKGDNTKAVHSYAVAAVDRRTGHISHLTEARSYRTEDQQQAFPASEMQNRGGNLVDGHHFENWGKPDDQLTTRRFRVQRSGRYFVRAEFSNGSGPVNTGITCAVKKLDLRRAAGGAPVASGYLIMPQSGDWKRWDLSSVVSADLNADEEYTLHISEDAYCRNMSYLAKNSPYTANPGGGPNSSNFVNLASIRLLFVSASSK